MGRKYFYTADYDNAKSLCDKAKARGIDCNMYVTGWGNGYEVILKTDDNEVIKEIIKDTDFVKFKGGKQ